MPMEASSPTAIVLPFLVTGHKLCSPFVRPQHKNLSGSLLEFILVCLTFVSACVAYNLFCFSNSFIHSLLCSVLSIIIVIWIDFSNY